MSSAPSQPLAAHSTPLARSPYQVDLLAADGSALETYQRGNRYYVLGDSGDRYSIRVKNPTNHRVEAVISVDGLDVVDGESADFVHKRGYVVPAYGQVVVDGFRTSTTQVAAFRFSSVSNSYADRKGKGRNVGVIGVAIFAERARPQVIMPQPTPPPPPVYDRDTREDASASGNRRGGYRGAGRAPASEPHGGTAQHSAPPPRTASADKSSASRVEAQTGTLGGDEVTCCRKRPSKRPGLGTAWGEQRYSAVQFTRFVRANNRVPTAIAELRYNDADGLRALGIRLAPQPGPDELYTRETADPFPASHFAAPPP